MEKLIKAKRNDARRMFTEPMVTYIELNWNLRTRKLRCGTAGTHAHLGVNLIAVCLSISWSKGSNSSEIGVGRICNTSAALLEAVFWQETYGEKNGSRLIFQLHQYGNLELGSQTVYRGWSHIRFITCLGGCWTQWRRLYRPLSAMGVWENARWRMSSCVWNEQYKTWCRYSIHWMNICCSLERDWSLMFTFIQHESFVPSIWDRCMDGLWIDSSRMGGWRVEGWDDKWKDEWMYNWMIGPTCSRCCCHSEGWGRGRCRWHRSWRVGP